jgi:hypothetical protein
MWLGEKITDKRELGRYLVIMVLGLAGTSSFIQVYNKSYQ